MKKRLDILMVERGLAPSREKAKALIMSGIVFVKNQKYDKAGCEIDENEEIDVRGSGLKYVSRGGLKLEKAIDKFDISLKEKVCMDIGASTGGFTDCMLQNGAVKVYAVDVGYGQLAWKLRTDERVVNFERTNIRNLTLEDIQTPVDFISIDVSFISLRLVLPVAFNLLDNNGRLVCLIKPQFEAGRDKVGKKGVVRDRAVHKEVVCNIVKIAQELNFFCEGLDFSPVKGPEGNIEYLLYLSKTQNNVEIEDSIDSVVNCSHDTLS